MTDRSFKKYGLSEKDKLIIELLEEILDELQMIRKRGGTQPAPS